MECQLGLTPRGIWFIKEKEKKALFAWLVYKINNNSVYFVYSIVIVSLYLSTHDTGAYHSVDCNLSSCEKKATFQFKPVA